MTANPVGPPCGNNPNYQMSDGDRAVVEGFRVYLTVRADRRDRYAAAIAAADDLGAPEVCYPEAAAAMAVADAEQLAARAEVLREAADAIEAEQHQLDDEENERLGGLSESAAAEHVAVHRAAATLRRMADEAQQS